VQTEGGTIDMRRSGSDDVDALFVAGGKVGAEGSSDSTYTFSFDDRKRKAYLIGGASMLGALPGPVFDPTWNSAFRWMQSRRFFAVSTSLATPKPQPAPQFETIVVVTRSPALSYHVVRTARGTCANHDPGWELGVVPISDPTDHPLTAVVIDDRTGLVCTMQFEETLQGVPPSAGTHGAIELQFDRVDGLYVVTAESIAMHLALPGPIRGMSATISFGQFNAQ